MSMYYNAAEMMFIGIVFMYCTIMGYLGLQVWLDERE